MRTSAIDRRATRSPSRRTTTIQARRRRIAVVVLALIGLVAWVGLPSVNHAVRQLSLPLRHADIIRQQARLKHLDPALIAAVIETESKFTDGTSAAGAQGLMQILPDTARFIARSSGATSFTTTDLSTPQVNISYGSWYLRYLLDRYANDKTLAIAAYNGGEANVDSWRAAAHRRGERFTMAAIRFPETRAYVERVLELQGQYRANYARELGV